MKPNAEARFCKNCHYPIPKGTMYCSCCGQKNLPPKIPFWQFIGEIVKDALSFDSKVIRSIPLLFFIPGKLTVEFFKGRRKSFVPPGRLFLFSILICFAVIQFNIGDVAESFNKNTVGQDPLLKIERNKEHNTMVDQVDSALSVIKEKYSDIELTSDIDSTFKFLEKRGRNDTMDMGTLSINERKVNMYRMAVEDVYTMDPDSLVEYYQVEGKRNRFIISKIAKVNKDGGSFMEFLFQHSAWGIFFIMPLLALFLKLIYFRRNRFYIEHVVLSLHYHSFAFLLIAIVVPFYNRLSQPVITIFWIWLGLYLFLAMKKYYQQGWIKTFFKFILVGFGYSFICVMAAMFLALVGMAFY